MALPLNHQTPAQFAARFWVELQILRLAADAGSERAKVRFSRRVWLLHHWVLDGELTSNEVRLSFNTAYGRSLNTAQWNSFVTNTLAPISERYQATLDQADL